MRRGCIGGFLFLFSFINQLVPTRWKTRLRGPFGLQQLLLGAVLLLPNESLCSHPLPFYCLNVMTGFDLVGKGLPSVSLCSPRITQSRSFLQCDVSIGELRGSRGRLGALASHVKIRNLAQTPCLPSETAGERGCLGIFCKYSCVTDKSQRWKTRLCWTWLLQHPLEMPTKKESFFFFN